MVYKAEFSWILFTPATLLYIEVHDEGIELKFCLVFVFF